MTAAGALAYGAYMIGRTILFGNPVPGYPSLLVVILFLGGAQLVTIGIIGEYLGRMFDESKQRPLYLLNGHEPAYGMPRDVARPESLSTHHPHSSLA